MTKLKRCCRAEAAAEVEDRRLATKASATEKVGVRLWLLE